MVKLSTVATISAGQSAPKNNYFSENGIPFIRAGSLEFLINGKGLDYCEKINETNAKICKLKLYPKNAVLFAKSGMSANKGRVYKLERDSYVVSHLAVVVTDSCKLLPSYFMYWLKINSPRTLIKDESYPSISLSDIGNLDIDCPSIEEQQRIVKILDKAEEIRTKKKLANEKLDEFLKSTFIDMFGDPVTNPKGYKKELIKNICSTATGSTPSRDNPQYYQNAIISWVKTGEVLNSYIKKTEERISQKAIDETNCKIFPVNTILVAMYGQGLTRGRVGMLKIEAATNQACCAILPGEKINQEFLFNLLKLEYETLRNLGRGGNQPNLNKGMINDFVIYLPPLEQQNQFAQIVQKVEAQKEKNQKVIEQMDNLFNSLMQQAFNK